MLPLRQEAVDPVAREKVVSVNALKAMKARETLFVQQMEALAENLCTDFILASASGSAPPEVIPLETIRSYIGEMQKRVNEALLTDAYRERFNAIRAQSGVSPSTPEQLEPTPLDTMPVNRSGIISGEWAHPADEPRAQPQHVLSESAAHDSGRGASIKPCRRMVKPGSVSPRRPEPLANLGKPLQSTHSLPVASTKFSIRDKSIKNGMSAYDQNSASSSLQPGVHDPATHRGDAPDMVTARQQLRNAVPVEGRCATPSNVFPRPPAVPHEQSLSGRIRSGRGEDILESYGRLGRSDAVCAEVDEHGLYIGHLQPHISTAPRKEFAVLDRSMDGNSTCLRLRKPLPLSAVDLALRSTPRVEFLESANSMKLRQALKLDTLAPGAYAAMEARRQEARLPVAHPGTLWSPRDRIQQRALNRSQHCVSPATLTKLPNEMPVSNPL